MTDFEKAILKEFKNGNIKTFELIFKGYYSSLCKYAYSLIRDYDQASDIVKDLFSNLWMNRETLEVKTSISRYLFKCVRNAAYNYRTRILPKQVCVNESDLYISISEMNNLYSESSPLEEIMNYELESRIYKAIEKLPEHCREIFILSRIELQTNEEIAQKLNISINTVKVQIYRAILKLKADLKNYLP